MGITWRASLSMVAAKEKEDSLRQMEATTKETLKIMLQMAMVNILIQADINTRGSGKAMFQTGEGKRSIPIKAGIMVVSSIIKNTEKEYSCKKGAFFREILSTISLKGREACRVIMESLMWANGCKIKNMVKDNTIGRMGANIKANINRISEMVKGL
jgi:hypothetical protein